MEESNTFIAWCLYCIYFILLMSLMPPPPNNNLVVVASTGLGRAWMVGGRRSQGGLRVDCPIEFYRPFLLMVHMEYGQISKWYYMVFICKFFLIQKLFCIFPKNHILRHNEPEAKAHSNIWKRWNLEPNS